INAPPITQNNLLNFSALLKSSTVTILSITYFKMSGNNNGIANLTIPISTVHTIFHVYGLTNRRYCFILPIMTAPALFLTIEKPCYHVTRGLSSVFMDKKYKRKLTPSYYKG